MSRFINLLGHKYGKLTVLEKTELKSGTSIIWKCLCDCGNYKNVAGNDLRRNKKRKGQQICGCMAGGLVHGMYRTPIYNTWTSMKSRCYNKKNDKYYRYGGRGITVCNEWINDFSTFYNDMGSRPIGMSIDRIDNDGCYSKDNCKWSTQSQQVRNSTSSKINGEDVCIIRTMLLYGQKPADIAIHFNVLSRTIRNIRRNVSWCDIDGNGIAI